MITIFENKETKEAKNHLRNLVRLAKSDGKIAKSEMACIYKIGSDQGLTKEQVNKIARKEGQEEIVIPETIKGKFNQLFDLVSVMIADGIIEDKEMKFCEEIAGKFGVRDVTKALLVTKIAQDQMAGKKKAIIFSESKAFLA